ncbi:hypothetical protein AMTRI_Chr03g141030 [Amborella trichopoda]
MVAVWNNKELLSWYLIALTLQKKVQAGAPTSESRPEPSSLGIEGEKDGVEKLDEEIIGKSETREEEWVITIREKLAQAHDEEVRSLWEKVSIYRVPKSLREGDEKAFMPQVVSIGPYHHNRPRLRDMERHKWRALSHTLTRTTQDVTRYLEAAREMEERTRQCYAAHISLSSDAFVEMMVLDGCFALEVMRGAIDGFHQLGYSRDDPVFAMRGVIHALQRDMIMLENQLPLFVFDRFLGIQTSNPDESAGATQLALCFFDPIRPNDEPFLQKESNRFRNMDPPNQLGLFDPLGDEGLHFLHVFRRSLLLTYPNPPSRHRLHVKHPPPVRATDKRRQQLIHCVTELRAAGIKLRKRKTDRFWDVRFSRGVLQIPRLLIHDGTKSLFLNLMAFEQCHLECGSEITSYIIFMDNLINSPEDVRYLHYRRIIEHWLGNDEEVAELFNKLCREIVFDMKDSYLSRLSEEVNKYYDHKWNTWGATLRQNYFNNPWAIISFFAALVLLILTFTQTFYSVLAYYRPPS